ncbi:hypothetical protein HPB49_021076 [Dermacentor silvarum]|uniref:Uncharacterized protein n=1 Tax=Dermacentor silvarum TaxID=543639 RepID=A0ACB8D7I2_DERSI|nr:hypothetical protein HPB49_021076 [Dermacentor silvarum]
MLKVTNRVDGRWDIAALAGLVSFFGIATNRNSGWFFVAFMEDFQVDRGSASWPNSVLTIMFRSSGLGAGLVLMCNLVEIMQYFQKYRGIASGLKFAADPTSAIAFPALLSYLRSMYVDYALDRGVSRAHAELTVTYASAPEIVGRVLLPLIADVGLVSRPALTAGNMVALGAFLAVTPETSGATHVVLRAASSLALATLMTMKHVLVADYFGTDAVALLSGASGVLLVPVLLSNPAIIGECIASLAIESSAYLPCVILCSNL